MEKSDRQVFEMYSVMFFCNKYINFLYSHHYFRKIKEETKKNDMRVNDDRIHIFG